MKITIVSYNPAWPAQFRELKEELADILEAIQPVIEHIGSTSVPGLAAKPVIDVQVGVKSESEFALVEAQLIRHLYVYYQVYNATMPNRRLFVRLKDHINPHHFPKIFKTYDNIPHEAMNYARRANVHVWLKDDPDFLRHLAFRDYLMAHPEIREQYARLKISLSKKAWKDMNEYNDGKNAFIKEEEAKALAWYKSL